MKKLLFILIALGGGLAGLVFWWQRPRTLAVEEKLFTYATVQRGSMFESISATGMLQPRDILLVVSELPGSVTDLAVKINDVVVEGQVLCRLDTNKVDLQYVRASHGVDTAKAALAQAEAIQSAADTKYKSELALQSREGFRGDLLEAEFKLKAAKAGVSAAKVQLDLAGTTLREAELHRKLSFVRVPERQVVPPEVRTKKQSYLVIERKVQIGQFVGPTASVPLFTLASDLSQMEVHAEVAEGDVGRVRKGQSAVFSVAAFGESDVKFQGVVKDIRPVPNNVKGAIFYTTVIEVANQVDPETNEWRLRPGMTATVDIIRREHPNVWKLPNAALTFQLEEAYQTVAAKERLATWKKRADQAEWKAIWIWEASDQSPWPIFVRLEKDGRKGFKDNEFIEVLEWENGREPGPNNANLKVITGAPPARTPGIFEQPTNIRLS